jgi:hypothetical protein
MSNHQFEKQIKNKMDNHSIEPSEDLLDRIFEKRAAQTKPALGFFNKKGVYFAAAALICTIVLFNVLSDSGKSVDIQNVTMNSNNEIANSEANQSNPSNSIKDQPKGSKNLQDNSSEEFENNVVNSTGKSDNQPVRNLVSRFSANKSNRSTNNSLAKNSDNTGENEKNSNNNFKNNSTNVDFLNVDPNVYFDVDASNRPSIDREQHDNRSHMYVYHAVSPNRLENNELTYSNTVKISKFPVLVSLDEAHELETKKVNNNKLIKKPIFIDLTFGQMFNQFISSSKIPELKGMSKLTKMSMSNTYDLRVSYPVSPRINLFTGIGMAQLNTQYKGDLNYQVSEKEQRTFIKYINDPILGPKQVIIHDTVDVMKNKSQNVDFKNQYSVLSIPIGASYNFGYKKFDFGVQGSMNFNFIKTSTVHIWGSENQGFNLQNNNSSFINIGLGTSVLAAYKISPKFRLLFEPSLRYYNIDGKRTGNSMNENLFNGSLSLGLRYTLF